MDNLEVALAALEKESQEWGDTQAALFEALSVVNLLNVSPEVFSFIDNMTGISSAYNGAVDHVRDVLNNGAVEMAIIAEALMKARNDFQSADESVAAEARKVWIPEY